MYQFLYIAVKEALHVAGHLLPYSRFCLFTLDIAHDRSICNLSLRRTVLPLKHIPLENGFEQVP